MLTQAECDDILARLGKAFFRADRTALEKVLTPDFEWHFAFGPDTPNGRVYRGVDGTLKGIADYGEWFEEMKFELVEKLPLGEDQMFVAFAVRGKWRNGPTFHERGAEIFTIRGGKLAKNDVFWKRTQSA
jgi:ketosteroid isomerase-like protein